jgi:hypothetical protein
MHDHHPAPRETFASLAISGLALALMITAGYFTPDLLAAVAH